MPKKIEPEQFAKHCIKTRIQPSPIHGVGVFAIKDIKQGEEVFPVWTGLTGGYKISKKDWQQLDHNVQKLITDWNGKNNICLFKGLPYVASMEAFVNYANEWQDVNVEYKSSIDYYFKSVFAIKDIREGEELLSPYLLERTK